MARKKGICEKDVRIDTHPTKENGVKSLKA